MPQKPQMPWWKALVEAPDSTPGKVLGQFQGEDLPPVVVPRMFRNTREPIVVGQDLGKRVKRFLDAVPGLREKLGFVVQGPTGASMQRMMGSGFAPDQFSGVNLLGITELPSVENKKRKADVGLNPDLTPGEHKFNTDSILAHELAHVGGATESEAVLAHEAYGGNKEAFDLGKWFKDMKGTVDEKALKMKAIITLMGKSRE